MLFERGVSLSFIYGIYGRENLFSDDHIGQKGIAEGSKSISGLWIKVFVKALPTAADSPINCNLSLRLSAVDRLRLLVIFKAKQNKRLIWFDLLLAYTLVSTVKMFAQKKLSWLLFVKYDNLVYI